MSKQLRVNPIGCAGHGLCAELLPELLDRDEWGYPLPRAALDLDPRLFEHAAHAVDACPLLALKIIG